jgi:ABC-2 type transport system ATP-binding protein
MSPASIASAPYLAGERRGEPGASPARPTQGGTAEALVETRDLTKRYGRFTAVDAVSLLIRRGEIYGFLGPNGAGKTTTILMLVGTIRPTSGSIELLGQPFNQDARSLRRHLGVISENQYLYDDMTALEYLDFFGRLYEIPGRRARIHDMLAMVNLWGFRDVLIRQYSRGMQQKLGIARALLHDPELLIWDEPVSGLDALAIRQVREIILSLRHDGKTVFLSSHILSEIEKTADRVGILFKGQLVAEDTVDHLRRRIGGDTEVIVEVECVQPPILEALAALPMVRRVRVDGQQLGVTVDLADDYRATISDTVFRRGGRIVGMRMREMSLEEMFVTLNDQTVAQLLSTGEEPI